MSVFLKKLQTSRELSKLFQFKHNVFVSRRTLIDSSYQQVPHYTELSALYVRSSTTTNDAKKASASSTVSPFSKIISPDLDMDHLFEENNNLISLNVNLSSRHIHLDLHKLKQDYLKVKELEKIINELNKEKEEISNKINALVKLKGGKVSKKLIMQTDEAKDLLAAGHTIKSKINKIQDELEPLKEIVNVACLRLPNHVHCSSLYIYNSQFLANKNPNHEFDTENNYKFILFNFNKNYLSKMKLIDWNTLNENKWSFVKTTSSESMIANSRYLVGDYAKVEQALVNFVYEKINTLNSLQNSDLKPFEHVKSISMFKSAIAEGCGQNFSDSRNNFNIVRFSHSATSSPSSPSPSTSSHKQHTNVELLHFTGASSLNALILDFVRTKTSSACLPWTVFTNGRNYSPKHGQVNCFEMLTLCSDASQKMVNEIKHSSEQTIQKFLQAGSLYLDEMRTELDAFLNKSQLGELIHSNEKKIDAILIDILKLIVYILKDMNIPIRFVCVNTHHLGVTESMRIEVQAYLPSEKHYITVRIA
jgi:seryl-tRNA synthetase